MTADAFLAPIAPAVLVGIGGAAGALARFAVGEYLGADPYPVSVVVVNALGSFIATLLVVLGPASDAVLVASVGFCGSLTTFSTFSVRTVTLWREGRRTVAASFATGTLLAALVGVGIALSIGSHV